MYVIMLLMWAAKFGQWTHCFWLQCSRTHCAHTQFTLPYSFNLSLALVCIGRSCATSHLRHASATSLPLQAACPCRVLSI